MATKEKIPANIQTHLNKIAKLIKEDKENQKKDVGVADGYKEYISKILDKKAIDPPNNTIFELTKDETQNLMYNISIIHYLIEQKKLEIEKIKLVLGEVFVYLFFHTNTY